MPSTAAASPRTSFQRVRTHLRNPGLLSTDDLAGCQARERSPVCAPYRRWQVCGMPPPSSGGIAVAQMLSLLEGRDLAALAPEDGQPAAKPFTCFPKPAGWFADRARYVADTDFVPLPGDSPAALIARTTCGDARH